MSALRARSGPSIGFAESKRTDTRPNDARSLAAGTSFSLSWPLAALRPRDGTANALPEVRGPLDAQDGGAGSGSACPAVAKTAGCASGLLLGDIDDPGLSIFLQASVAQFDS